MSFWRTWALVNSQRKAYILQKHLSAEYTMCTDRLYWCSTALIVLQDREPEAIAPISDGLRVHLTRFERWYGEIPTAPHLSSLTYLGLRSACSSRSIERRDTSIHHGHWRTGGPHASWHPSLSGLLGMYSAMSSLASPLSSAVLWHPVHSCMGWSFCMQSENVASHFPYPCCNNVLESSHACAPHHLFICDMVAPRDAEDCT